MKKLSLILVLIFIISSAFTSSSGVIHGIISNEAGKPLRGIGIKLKLGARTIDYVYTNSKGHFTFENLDEGSYKVLVSGYAIGYNSRFFQNVDVQTDEILKMNLALSPAKRPIDLINRSTTDKSVLSGSPLHQNTTTWADYYEDWSDISNRNKK